MDDLRSAGAGTHFAAAWSDGKRVWRQLLATDLIFKLLAFAVLTPLVDELEEGWEGCLSVPGLRGVVPRWTHLGYRGFDPEGALIEREATGFHARVVQHECDHLDGILYPMRIRDFTRFGYTEVLFPDADIPED